MNISIYIPRWPVSELIGYQPLTTAWQDFHIAVQFGGTSTADKKQAITETYDSLKKEFAHNYKHCAELYLVLNHLIWYFYEKGHEALASIFNDLWDDFGSWVYKSAPCMKSREAKDYFFSVTD